MAEKTQVEKDAEAAERAQQAKAKADAQAAVKQAELEAAQAKADAKKAAEDADKYLIEVRTTSVGALPIKGLVAINTVMKVPYTSFSAAWMKPSTTAAKNKLARLQKAAGINAS